MHLRELVAPEGLSERVLVVSFSHTFSVVLSTNAINECWIVFVPIPETPYFSSILPSVFVNGAPDSCPHS